MNEGKVEGAGSSKMAPTLLHTVAVGGNGVMESKEGIVYHKGNTEEELDGRQGRCAEKES